MVETAGTKLRRTRTQRRLSLEDAARATKIRPAQLSDLENDDYSNFANLAYARGFLVSYGKYLHLDVRPYMDAFADANTFGLDDYQYLSETPVGEYRAPTRPWRKRRRGNVRQVLALAAGIVLLAVAVFGFNVYVSFKRLGDLDRLKDRQSAREPAATGGTQTASAVTEAAPQPKMLPVSSTPGPAASVPPTASPAAPDATPANDDTRAAAATLAATGIDRAPAGLLTQVVIPPFRSPVDPNAPSASPTPGGGAARLGFGPDKVADPDRNAPKPQKVVNNGRP